MQKRRDEAKRKLHQERKLNEEKLARDKMILEEGRKRKELEEQQAELRYIQEQEALIESGGIKVEAVQLIPYEIEGNDDKVILSEDMLNELTTQDAFSKGPMYFKVTATRKDSTTNETRTKVTHVGVREFTAEKGRIGIPPKVVDSLKEGSNEILHIDVKYVRLSKCTYVKLRPKANDFFSVSPVKLMLEQNLQLHSTLTQGDVLTVWYRGHAHILTVIDMKPESRGSLIDSDVEVDLDLSEEFMKNQSATQEAKASLDVPSSKEDVKRVKQESSPSPVFHRLQNASVSALIDDIMTDDPASLIPDIPDEPESASDNIITVRFKTPSSGTFTRKFLKSSEIKSVIAFVSKNTNTDINRIQISIRYPARTFTFASTFKQNETFESAGILTNQETFIVTFLA